MFKGLDFPRTEPGGATAVDVFAVHHWWLTSGNETKRIRAVAPCCKIHDVAENRKEFAVRSAEIPEVLTFTRRLPSGSSYPHRPIDIDRTARMIGSRRFNGERVLQNFLAKGAAGRAKLGW